MKTLSNSPLVSVLGYMVTHMSSTYLGLKLRSHFKAKSVRNKVERMS